MHETARRMAYMYSVQMLHNTGSIPLQAMPGDRWAPIKLYNIIRNILIQHRRDNTCKKEPKREREEEKRMREIAKGEREERM